MPDLTAAADALALAQAAVDTTARHLAANGGVDANQAIAYDLAHATAAVEAARTMLAYGERGEVEAKLTCAFAADALFDVATRILGREKAWGLEHGALAGAAAFVETYRDPAFLAPLAFEAGPTHLDDDFELVRDTFRRFAEEQVLPHAEHVHRTNADVPESIISAMSEIGGFGISIPDEYGGSSTGGEEEYIGVVVATEELSRASLCIGGSLFTRPEIFARALLAGGTEEQKQEWLPQLASGELLTAVAVTEPDYGSDVAGIRTTATKVDGGWLINGVKTWCTMGARAHALMLLARTDPDTSKAHKGISMFLVPKPIGDGEGFAFTQEPHGTTTGKMEGRPIDTLGYRGLHSYEIAIDNWYVEDQHLIGGEGGLGRGFYLQMAGFENGRLQTAARAVGVMQAAYEAARQYAQDRVVFGHPIADYQLTQVKLARMAATIQAMRQFAYAVARLMGKGEGSLEASMLKAYVCRAGEWVTREAMQIHGGMGYAEEFPVSRYFVDARVLSIFEGADETLCLKVVAPRLLQRAG
jgi:(2S)-methylsuccinyl-CoA dehydrogenase